MLRLLFTIVATFVALSLVLAVLGGDVGTPELLIWTVLLVAAVTAEVRYFQRHKASPDPR